jgi:hypothetical protein
MSLGWPRATKRLLVAGTLVGAVALALLVFLAPSLYEVQDKGRGVVPYDSGLVYKVRVLDLFTVYASEETRPEADKLSAIGLVVAATVLLMTVLLLNRARTAARLRRFYTFAAAGLVFLAADESFGLHETLGHNIQFLSDVPGVNRPDDLIFSLYAIPVAILAWQFRDVLLAHRPAVRLFAVGIFFFAAAAVADVAGAHIDELAEIITALCLLAGLVSMTVTTLSQELDLDGIAASRVGRLARPANGSTRRVAPDRSPPGAGLDRRLTPDRPVRDPPRHQGG